MCGLYGVLSYGNKVKDMAEITEALAVESAVRGTDATGIAYNKNSKMTVFKKSKSAYEMSFSVPKNTVAVMGHTRHATQGTLNFNGNNHPFKGMCGDEEFALAHNGIICNDKKLRRELRLPSTIIDTDSYIAVQLILLWTQGKNMLCEEEKLEWKKIFLNVNIISIIAGIVLFLFRIKLPAGVQDVLGMMNNMIGPLGMLLAGMAIAEVPLKSIFTKKRNYLSVALRLLLYPVLGLFLMKAIQIVVNLENSSQILLTVYLACVTPACASVTSMAQLYDKDAAYASSLYVLTTLLSIVTMPVMVYLYEMMM